MDINNDKKWAIGLIEGEGYIGFNRNNHMSTWVFQIKVSMKSYNIKSIYKLKHVFGIGKIHKDKAGMCTWKVTRFDQIKNIIIPVLEQYQLRGIKAYELIIIKEAMSIYESSQSGSEKTIKLTHLKDLCIKAGHDRTRNISPYWLEKAGGALPPKFEKTFNEANITWQDYKLYVPDQKDLDKLIDPDWLAGFIEGEGSFQINDRLQTVFELGQSYNIYLMHCIQKYLGVTANLKTSKDNSYTSLSTKHPHALDKLNSLIQGKMRGVKSFELVVWNAARNTKLITKKEKAKLLLNKIRSRDRPINKE